MPLRRQTVRLSIALIAIVVAGCAAQAAPRITPERHAANIAGPPVMWCTQRNIDGWEQQYLMAAGVLGYYVEWSTASW